MAARYLIPIAVFVGGFGLGYGITWLLVGSPPQPQPVVEAVAADGVPAEDRAVAAGGVDDPEGAAPSGDEAPAAEGAAVSPNDDEGAIDDEAGDEPGADEGADEGGGGAAPAEAAPGAGEDGTAEAPADERAEETPWWDACAGKVCALDFGGITGGLSIREGRVPHGKRMNWKAEFGNAKRVDYLETNDGLKVEVRGISMGADGFPSAAEIVWQKSRTESVAGVISMNLGDKRVTMKPVAGTP